MRIIGHLPHPHLKITVFQMDNKLSIKFESGLYEQIYKFRMSNKMSGMEAIQQLVDTPFLEAVQEELNRMHQIKNKALSRLESLEEEDEFEEII